MQETISTQSLNDLRRRIANGGDYDLDEVKNAIQAIRADRQEKGDSSANKKKQTKSTKKSEAPSLSDLGGA